MLSFRSGTADTGFEVLVSIVLTADTTKGTAPVTKVTGAALTNSTRRPPSPGPSIRAIDAPARGPVTAPRRLDS